MTSGQLQVMLANTIEQGLEFVREAGDVIQTEHASAALDRVGSAEDCVEVVVGRDRNVDPQQQAFHVRQVLRHFFEEDLLELADINAHRCIPGG